MLVFKPTPSRPVAIALAMLFNSFSFLIFFVVVYAAFWMVPTWPRKKLLLLLASLVFYAAWYPPNVLILLFSITLDWLLARQLGKSEQRHARRCWLAISLICNLGLLGFFKYGDFFLKNLAAALAAIGLGYQPADMGILLPIGISFYTFASLSYTIDVYRREIRGNATFTDYALFVSFFPHLVAGPIVRASVLLPQIENPKMPGSAQVGWGINLICLGLFAKTVLADALFAPLVNAVYTKPGAYGIIDSWGAVLSFSGQIYYDFCGYSMCAVGLAMCFGFWFPNNFNAPYGARSFTDFWRRWHISLSTWLRDYLYIPLGGNRHGEMRTYAALGLTMLLGGLWHGASWMFILWGALHGTLLCVERALGGRVPSDALRPSMKSVLVFLAISLIWIPFRAADGTAMLAIFAGLAGAHGVAEAFALPVVLSFCVIALTVASHIRMRDRSLVEAFGKLPHFVQGASLAACLIAMFLFSDGNQNAFIYFQF